MASYTYLGNDAADKNAGGVMPTSSAAINVRKAFLGQLSTSRVETFEYSAPDSRPSATYPLLVFSSTGELTQADAINGNVQRVRNPGGEFAGRFNTTPDSTGAAAPTGIWWQTTGDFTVTLNTPTTVFGFNGTDFGRLGAAGGTVKLDFYNGVTLLEANVEVGPDIGGIIGSVLFFGYKSDAAFDKVQVKVTQGSGTHIIGFDDLVIGTPKPSTPYNGPGEFANSPTGCIVACPPEAAQTAVINIPYGFTDRWSTWTCFKAGSAMDVSVSFWAGLNATGSSFSGGDLAAIRPSNVGTGDAFQQSVFVFSPGQVVKSLKLTSSAAKFNNEVFLDHMEFGNPPPLPNAPVLSFNWLPLTSDILTPTHFANTGAAVKFGIDFESLIAGPNAAAGTYLEVAVTNQYSALYAATTFVNAVAIRSKESGGTGLFGARTLLTNGSALSLGKVALKLAAGQTKLTINTPQTGARDAFSFYYASTAPITVKYWANANGLDDSNGTIYYTSQTFPATGTCSLPDVDNVYCQWALAEYQAGANDSNSYKSVTIETTDPNAMFDNVTVGYPVPNSGYLFTASNVPDQYYNGGADSLGSFGPANGVAPPYPPIYGVTFSSDWYRSYYQYGPELAPDYFYKPGDLTHLSSYGWVMLKSVSSTNSYINVPNGFIEGFSVLLKAGTFVGITSGPNGTGTYLNTTLVAQRTGGYKEYTVDGWARCIVFRSFAILDGLRIGHKDTSIIAPFPYIPTYEQSNSGAVITRESVTYRPEGTIIVGSNTTLTSSNVPDHWIREVPATVDMTGAVIQFSFDGLSAGQTEILNQGTLGGTWETKSANVAGAVGVSKFGTSSLRVRPDATEPRFELVWPAGLGLLTEGTGTAPYIYSSQGTLEAWIRPEGGTSSPFGKTTLMYWAYGGYKRGKEWNVIDDSSSNFTAAVYVFAKPSVTPGQVIFQCFHGPRFIGEVSVATGSFHHVAVSIIVTNQTITTCSFFVDGVRIGGPTTTTLGGLIYTGDSQIVLGQADRFGTFEYYISEARATRGSVVYNDATYTVPAGPFTPQAALTFAGSNLWIKATIEPSTYGETVNASIIPDGYNGPTLNAWKRFDIARQYAFDFDHNAKQQLKLQIATDSAGSNIIATSHPRGAKRLSINPSSVEYTGNTTFTWAASMLTTNGMMEPAYSGASTLDDARTSLTKKLSTWRSEPFEDFAVGATTPLLAYFPLKAGRLTCTITGSAIIANTSSTGQVNTTLGGSRWLAVTGPVTFSVSSPICSFGVNVTDLGDGGSYIKLVLTDTAGRTSELSYPHSLTLVSGSQRFIGFHHPGRSYISVVLASTDTASFGDIGLDDLILATREQVSQQLLTYQDSFTSNGTLADSVPTNGNYWTEAYAGANSLANLVLNNVGGAYVKPEAYGARLGVILGNPVGRDVTLLASFTTGTVVRGLEYGIIARKNSENYYHLTYTVYPAKTLQVLRGAVNNTDMLVVKLVHYPSGDVLFGPIETIVSSQMNLKYELVGNTHCIYYVDILGTTGSTIPGVIGSGSLIASVFDNRILTGGQCGFSINQPAS